MNLYELTGVYQHLQNQIEDGDEQALESLDIVSCDMEQAYDGYAKLMRNLAAEAEAMREEEKRQAEKRRAIEKGIDRLKEAVYTAMTITGQTKVKTSIGTWGIQKNPFSVKVYNASKVPERFLIPQPPTIDRAAILAEFKETGEVLDGVEIAQGEGVRFR